MGFKCILETEDSAVEPNETELSPRTQQKCQRFLDGLTAEDLEDVRKFAEHRLARVGLDTALGPDLAQEALRAVLAGLTTRVSGRHKGRHPRPSDLQTKRNFLDYLKGAVNSLVTTECRRRKRGFQLIPLEAERQEDGEHYFIPLSTPSRQDVDVGWNDFRKEFFRRLSLKAPPKLQRMIAAWQDVWPWSDRIPVPIPMRRLRKHIRELSKEVLCELDETLGR